MANYRFIDADPFEYASDQRDGGEIMVLGIELWPLSIYLWKLMTYFILITDPYQVIIMR